VSNYKVIYDNVHGYIPLSNLIVMVMDSRQFQRLRKLKQLGSCHYVYQNAVHTRHEHSIGTSYLAGKLMESIMGGTKGEEIDSYLGGIRELKSYYDRKYGGKVHVIDEYIIELVKIAALCHDIGHGPFSHVFDDFFIAVRGGGKNPMEHHEIRSGIFLEQIIKENRILSEMIGDDQISFMKNLINPREEHQGFIYQIVSNNFNGLDVDKYDYLARDSYMIGGRGSQFESQRLVEHIKIINNTICYPEQATSDIIALFNTRYNLHKNVYGHKGVLSAQYMIVEIFGYLDPVIGLYESINDFDKFSIMTDEYILTCHHTLLKGGGLSSSERENVMKAKEVIDLLDAHKLYAHVDTFVSKEKMDIGVEDFKLGDRGKIIVHMNKIGFVSGSKSNPLDCVYAYRTKDNFEKKIVARKIDVEKYSLLVANNYQEWVTMIFYKEKGDGARVEQLRGEFREILGRLGKVENDR